MLLNNFLSLNKVNNNFLGNKYSNVFGLFIYISLITFLYLRVPNLFGGLGLFLYVVAIIFPLFLSLFFIRVENSVSEFFASLIPANTPLWIAPLVGLAESISYVVRPFVLVIRPFLNITIGALGAGALSSFFLNNKLIIFFLLFIFFYEIFVAVVHWFIVINILLFSKDH
nr:ATP synthase F0 subunit 6 [Rhabdosynochus viridisi]